MALPILYLFLLSFLQRAHVWGVDFTFTLDNYKSILEPLYLDTFWQSLKLASVSYTHLDVYKRQVSYSMIFKSLFAPDGVVNRVLMAIGLSSVDWFQSTWPARWVIVIALIWRWTGYNMVFYLAGLQNIDYSVYEASYIDGATPFQQFMKITIPLLKPTILMTAIMSTSGTLQLFDESMNLTAGGPGKSTMTLAHYIYNISFVETPKFNYAAALSVCILVMVAVLSAIQMKVGDKRD